MLLRMGRVGKALSIVRCEDSTIAPLDDSVRDVDDLGAPALMQELGIDEAHPLRLLVPNIKSRKKTKTIRTEVLGIDLPRGAFFEVVPGNDSATRIEIPEHLRVFVESPALALVQFSRELRSKAKQGSISMLETKLRLLEFCDECCGYYRRDAKKPRTGKITYDRPNHPTNPATAEEIKSFLNELRFVDGLHLAREVANCVVDKLGSAMEGYLFHALTLPPRWGGLSMGKPLSNEQLQVSEGVWKMLKHKSLKPDIQWPEYRVLVEYLGDKEHASSSARKEDKNRMQDYAIARYSPFPLMFDDVRNADALNKTAEMIARELMRHGKEDELYRVRRYLKDDAFRDRQRTLIKVLLPPVTDCAV